MNVVSNKSQRELRLGDAEEIRVALTGAAMQECGRILEAIVRVLHHDDQTNCCFKART